MEDIYVILVSGIQVFNTLNGKREKMVLKDNLYTDGVAYPWFNSLDKARDYIDKRLSDGCGHWVCRDVKRFDYENDLPSGWFDCYDQPGCYVELTITRLNEIVNF